ncbi:F-box domain-containing protein [Mycena venus]|uniref:F-box domain-containing protein n=1 Tax=Mycena venus TaxID=2733690 RepID=A0A8H6YVI1_9AGAR|nr:F-box domain-containing protein [Mycena venus]
MDFHFSWLCESHDYLSRILRMNSTLPNQCFPPNPDISGLGVRLSFYVQTIALGKDNSFTLRSEKFGLDAARDEHFRTISFGLTISALVTAVQNALPLYQAIIVTDLVWLANWAIFMALATYNRHPRGSHVVQYTAIGQTYISMSLILYLWARASTLDAGFQTTGETVFVVMFKSTSATGAGRTVALVITAVLLIGYSIVAAIFLKRRFIGSIKRSPQSIQLRRRRGSTPSTTPSQATPPAVNPIPRSNPSTSGSAPTRLPPSLALDPHLIILGLFILVPYVITVGSTELQIQRNQQCPDNAPWGFGQILAMAVTIVPVVTTLGAFKKYGWKQRPRVLPETENAPGGSHV